MKKRLIITLIVLLVIACLSVIIYVQTSQPTFICPGTPGEAYETFGGGAFDRWKRVGEEGCNWELLPGNSVGIKVPDTYRMDYWTGSKAGQSLGPSYVRDVVQGTMWKLDTSSTQY